MSRPWDAERAVSIGLARGLLARQFPELAGERVEPFGVGWDNSAFLVGGEWVFRFPRRKLAAALIEREIAILPRVAPGLPLPVPVPTFAGRPAAGYPWPFAGYRRLPGAAACRARLDAAGRQRAARPLARFLAALHATGAIDGPRPWLPILEDLPADFVPRARALVHGDLYARHVLVDARGAPSGVIDWGDVHAGEPAVDLSLAHAFLPDRARGAFRDAYGPIDEPTWRMARFRALHSVVHFLRYGCEVGDAALVDEGRTALAHLAGYSI